MKKWLKQLDENDYLVLSGMVMMAIGLTLLSIPIALSVTGGVLMVIGLVGAWRKAE